MWIRIYLKETLQKIFTEKSVYQCYQFMSPVKVKSFLTLKDKLVKMLLSGLVYKYKCGGCNAIFYGKGKCCLKVRICKHLSILCLTGKKLKIDNNKLMVIQEHLLCCNYSQSVEDFSI